MRKKILLTFDVEEFDLPEEYQLTIDKGKQLAISTQGLLDVLAILRKHQVMATFFTTAFYAENNPQIIRQIADEGHEIASHLYYHSDYNPTHILASKQKLEEIIGQEIFGIRIPRLRKMDLKLIKDAGYLYDSSLNPTYLPGRYNHFFKPKTLFFDKNAHISVLPFSVSPLIRFPLFWLSFKNIPFSWYFLLCKQALIADKYLHLYFHPWEFTDLSEFAIPAYIKKKSGQILLNQLEKLIIKLKDKGEFVTIVSFLKK